VVGPYDGGREKSPAAICRKVAKEIVAGNKAAKTISESSLEKYLGPQKMFYGAAEETDEVGVATGVAWTEAGGDLMSIEVTVMEGKGGLQLTGQLGEVMKESAQAAYSYIRSKAGDLGVESQFWENADIHIHVPAGAIPKDGPSAGITMCLAMVSALTRRPISREVCMTGEITLRGRVLPIGGLKEKLLAAARGGIKTVLIPEDNAKDLTEISDAIKGGMEIIPVARLNDVVTRALVRPPVPIVWEEDTKLPVKPDASDEASGGLSQTAMPASAIAATTGIAHTLRPWCRRLKK